MASVSSPSSIRRAKIFTSPYLKIIFLVDVETIPKDGAHRDETNVPSFSSLHIKVRKKLREERLGILQDVLVVI